jgi:hypothetical protein
MLYYDRFAHTSHPSDSRQDAGRPPPFEGRSVAARREVREERLTTAKGEKGAFDTGGGSLCLANAEPKRAAICLHALQDGESETRGVEGPVVDTSTIPSCPKTRSAALCGVPPIVAQYAAEAFVASDRSLAGLPERQRDDVVEALVIALGASGQAWVRRMRK